MPEPAAPGTPRRPTCSPASTSTHQRGPRRPDPARQARAAAPAAPQPAHRRGEVLAELHAALAGKPWVNQLVKEAAGPRSRARRARRARLPRAPPVAPRPRGAAHRRHPRPLQPDDPGLVPTRVHGIFRGLHGLYACINPTATVARASRASRRCSASCSRRPARPATPAAAASSRSPRAAAAAAPTCSPIAEIESLDRLSFLWGETEGALLRIELLPAQPRYTRAHRGAALHLRTGYVDTDNRFPDDEVRSLHLWQDGDGRREPSFDRCAMCQPRRIARAASTTFAPAVSNPSPRSSRRSSPSSRRRRSDPLLPNQRPQGAGLQRRPAESRPPGARPRAQPRPRPVPAGRRDRRPRASRGPRADGDAVAVSGDRLGVRGARLRPVPFPDHTADTEDQDRASTQPPRAGQGKDAAADARNGQPGWLAPHVSVRARRSSSELTDRYYSLQSLALATVEEDPAIAYTLR
jgi:hypothetical protein